MTEPAEQAAPSPDSRDGAPQRLYFHVGLPKSGSTYLQSVLGGNRGALKDVGHVYPYVRQEGMFHAAVEMAGNPSRWGWTRRRSGAPSPTCCGADAGSAAPW